MDIRHNDTPMAFLPETRKTAVVDLADLQADIVTQNVAKDQLGRIATKESIAIRIGNFLEEKTVLYALDGSKIQDGQTWKIARGCEITALTEAKALLHRLVTQKGALTF